MKAVAARPVAQLEEFLLGMQKNFLDAEARRPEV